MQTKDCYLALRDNGVGASRAPGSRLPGSWASVMYRHWVSESHCSGTPKSWVIARAGRQRQQNFTNNQDTIVAAPYALRARHRPPCRACVSCQLRGVLCSMRRQQGIPVAILIIFIMTGFPYIHGELTFSVHWPQISAGDHVTLARRTALSYKRWPQTCDPCNFAYDPIVDATILH